MLDPFRTSAEVLLDELILLLSLQEICDEYHPVYRKAQTISEEKPVQKYEFFGLLSLRLECFLPGCGTGCLCIARG
jgi:hypothetical protein